MTVAAYLYYSLFSIAQVPNVLGLFEKGERYTDVHFCTISWFANVFARLNTKYFKIMHVELR